MADLITAVVAHDASMPGDTILTQFPRDLGVVVVETVNDFAGDLNPLLSADADVCVVACGPQSEEALEVVRWWISQRPDLPVVVLAQGSPNGFVRRAFEAGAEDIVVVPDADHLSGASTQDIAFALQKAVARRAVPVEKPGAGPLICVLGPKGGIGKTLTSCNLSVALAASGKSVVLVDLDLQFGDLGLSLALSPERTIFDLAVLGGTLDADKVDAYLTPHSSGMKVMLAPVRPDQASAISVSFLQEVYDILRTSFDYVVVDTPPGFTPEVIATIDASTHICMLGNLDALSLKNTKLGLETLDLMGYDREHIRVVLNRADSNVGITHNDVVSIIGRSPDILVPSNREITRSVNDGIPITMSAKKSEAAKAFVALADLYNARRVTAAAAKKSGRSLLRRHP